VEVEELDSLNYSQAQEEPASKEVGEVRQAFDLNLLDDSERVEVRTTERKGVEVLEVFPFQVNSNS
jgi:hypothetical protein